MKSKTRHSGTLLALTAFCIVSGLAITKSPRAEPVQAAPAYNFVNATGLATHFDWGSSPYAVQFETVRAALAEIGVRHIRQGVGNTLAAARLRALNDSLGVKLTAVIDARTGSGSTQQLDPGQIADQLNALKNTLNPNMVVALEGPNEWNMTERLYGRTTWPDELRSYQAELFRQVKADPQLRSKPVLAPALSDPMRQEQYSKLGNMEQMTDRGNAHVYPNWLPFESKVTQVLPYARISFPTQRFWVTENGWHTAINSGAQFIDEATRAKYLGRAMAAYASNSDLERVYYYQFVDDEDNPALDKNNKHMGLMSFDLVRKPSFYAMRNTMAVMCDSPLAFSPQSLDFALSGELTDARTLLFQKNNRAFYLLIWLEKPGFYKGEPIDNPSQAVTLQLSAPVATMRRYRPTDPDANLLWAQQPKYTSYNQSKFTFLIKDHLTIIELVPPGVPTPPVNNQCSFSPA